MKKTLLIIALLSGLFATAFAEPKISLLTCFPGSEVYELEGHTALRIVDENGDMAYNWGTFDFNSPNFLYRFVKGETDYMLSECPTQLFLGHYDLHGRRVIEQDLNLSPEQAAELKRLVNDNMLPQNRVYRYNYVLDNCATRPLMLIEQATGDSITLPPYAGAGSTFREAMMYYHSAYPWYQFGIDLALGNGIDRQVTSREKSFAPMDLMEMLRTVKINDGSGARVPIVGAERVLVKGTPGGASEGPTPWWLTPLFWCWIVFAASTVVTWRDMSARKLSRWFDTLLFGIFGVAGLLLTFLIFVSVHEATSPNWLYLWLNPGCLFIAVGVWIKSWKRAVYWWQIVNFALVLILGLLGAYGVQKLNAAFWPLILSDLMRSIMYIYHCRCNATCPSHRV